MKIVEKSNFRVVIEPRGLGNFGWVSTSDRMFYPEQEQREKEYMRRCEDIKEQVERHVDEVGYVNINWDEEEVCSFCGYRYEEDENGIPVCCDEAIREHNAKPQNKSEQ